MLFLVTVVYLLIVTSESGLKVVDAMNPTSAERLKKAIKYNPQAEVVPQRDFYLLELRVEEFIKQDSLSVGKVVGKVFLPIPETGYQARSRLVVEKTKPMGGYVGEITKRYRRYRRYKENADPPP